jgi:hypothetical protein
VSFPAAPKSAAASKRPRPVDSNTKMASSSITRSTGEIAVLAICGPSGARVPGRMSLVASRTYPTTQKQLNATRARPDRLVTIYDGRRPDAEIDDRSPYRPCVATPPHGRPCLDRCRPRPLARRSDFRPREAYEKASLPIRGRADCLPRRPGSKRHIRCI